MNHEWCALLMDTDTQQVGEYVNRLKFFVVADAAANTLLYFCFVVMSKQVN